MTTQTLMDTDYATLWFYPEAGIVHHAFHKYIYGEEFRSVLTLGLEVVQQSGAQKWLSDDRHASSMPQADYDWAEKHWIEPMIHSGWKYWAVVLPDKLVGRQSLLRVMEAYAKYGLQVATFDDPTAAYAWLESVDR